MQLGKRLDIHQTSFWSKYFYWFIQIYNIIFSYYPEIAKASLGGQCLYKTKYALQKLYKLIQVVQKVKKSY